MKSKGILFAAVLSMLTLGSCTKDWDCECTMGSGDTTVVTHDEIEATTYNKAKDKCESKDASSFGSCKLKA